MWSLLFYYALLNAVCLAVLLMISADPPVWDEEDALAETLPPGSTGESTVQRPATPPLVFEIDTKAVA